MKKDIHSALVKEFGPSKTKNASVRILLCITENVLLNALSFNKEHEVTPLSPVKLQCRVMSLQRIVKVFSYMSYKIHPKPGSQMTLMTTWATYKNSDGVFIYRGIILELTELGASVLIPCLWRHCSERMPSVNVPGLPMRLKGTIKNFTLDQLEIGGGVLLVRDNSKTTINFEIAMFNSDGYLYGNYGGVEEEHF